MTASRGRLCLALARLTVPVALLLAVGCSGEKPLSGPTCPEGQTWLSYDRTHPGETWGDPGDGECGTLYEDGSYSIDGTPGCLPEWPCSR